MKQPTLQFALRELTSIIRRPRLWIVFAIVCAIFALTGPFGTFESLKFPARLGYWVIVQILTWGIALAVISFCGAVRQKPAFSDMATVLVGALFAAVPIGLVVELVGAQVFARPLTLAGTVWQIALSAPISVLLGLLATLFLQEAAPELAAPARGAKPGEKLLRRLPAEKRGTLLYLSMQDHYVEVVTIKGAALILLRFQEALDELKGYEGLQIHRSHWAAFDAVEELQREGGKLLLKMRDGTSLPVSRSFAKPVREALEARVADRRLSGETH
ncbi:MAG: LytTR family transcriptional regulator [Alphaproteobacteria bacterium]|nr:LytTR family transcriptional regulator [Alphaproteobacteria bacterium]